MNPIKLSQQLQNTLINYLTTTFDVNRDGEEAELANFIKHSFSRPRALFAGPYLELTAPYETAETLQDLADKGTVSPKLLEMPCFKQGKPLPVDAPLYTHQATALRKLCTEDRNIVVSSGTGSGKTECFLIPILNELLIDPSPGVRAVLIYPLNALVNDQLDRLRLLLQGTDITFGRYTSELAYEASKAEKAMQKEWQEMEPARRELFSQYPLPNEVIGRDQIQSNGKLPQILITNYAMLEYLLLRPQDKYLFNQGKWRFVVLDEAHTYAGAQGIEVGLLIRRLKHRLGHKQGEMRCIATSATLTNDDAQDACQFAQALFGETFADDDIIFGKPNHNYIPPAKPRQPLIGAYIHKRFDELLDNVRQEQWESTDEMALLMEEMGLINEEDLSFADQSIPSKFLWEVLRGNEDLGQLRRLMSTQGQPMAVADVANKLFGENGRFLPPEKRAEALYHLIELASMARPDINETSLLPARYHLFVRPPQGIWACLNAACPDKPVNEAWSKLFATPRDTCNACQAPVYPIVVCRTCGQVYLRLHKYGKRFLPNVPLEAETKVHYVTWRRIIENRALGETEDEIDDEDVLMAQAGESQLIQTDLELCLSCGHEINKAGRCQCDKNNKQKRVTLYLLQLEKHSKRGKRQGTTKRVVEHMNECGRCHSRALKGTEIATEVTMTALTPLAVLTEDLYRTLPPSAQKTMQQKAGAGRKLLSFYDSRQGAARFAAFVQDVVNQQAYRRIMIQGVRASATATFWPDLEKVSEACLDLTLRYRVAHNDPELSQYEILPRDVQYLNQSQQKRVIRHIRKQIFAEITTQLRSRQSLEALGLLSVYYFEPHRQPNLAHLASKLGLSEIETQTLIEYLLDDLRRGKVVTLPNGVQRDDRIFGRNKFSPRLVRGEEAGSNEILWIGKTPRQRRRRLVEKVLHDKGLASDETAVIQALTDILDWLIDKSDLLDTSRPETGYQIRHDRLFFQANAQWYRCNQCQRLNCRGNALLCPHAHCNGQLHPIQLDTALKDSFYFHNLHETIIPMRIEEHTAQLDPDKGHKYQNQFKSGDINMLSCSTTFEMGIDLGDLQAVIMSNIPPTVANYKQRAGRAGRRTSGTAFILAWASNRPHDQSYFKTPADIINGRVQIPYLNVQNTIIIQRHVNAIILSEFLRYCAEQRAFDKNTGAFFDEQIPEGPYYPLLPAWVEDRQDYLLSLLQLYAHAIDRAISPIDALQSFSQILRQKGYEHYQSVANFYKQARQELAQKQVDLIMQGLAQRELGQLPEEMERYGKLLDRLRDEDIINYLSDRGVLPSYSFPLHTVELRIPPHLLPSKQLRLQRNLQQAIREYAPGQEIVADKRIWKSEGLDFFGKEPQIFDYHICPNCNHLRLEETAGKPLDKLDQPCPVCYQPPKRRAKQHKYIQPDGFRTTLDSGQPAGQYVDRPFNLMRAALVPSSISTHAVSQVLSLGYDRQGKLLYVNEGFNGSGFKICSVCGKHVNNNRSSCNSKINGQPCPGKISRNQVYMLGFKQDTDTLHLKFASSSHILLPAPNDEHFWPSLKYALLHGASQALQIERRDIDAVLVPEGADGYQWQQTIVLYDNVPGGAGHVKRIEEEIAAVIAAALEILNCDCEHSCYRCLREYSNQWEHHLLDRHPVIPFLRALDADLQQQQQSGTLGIAPVAAIQPIVWLWEQISNAKSELILAIDKLNLESPTADFETWLDLIQGLLQQKVKVRLYLQQLPDQNNLNTDAITIATHLQLLLRKGLDLRLSNRTIPWTAIIDPNSSTSVAVKTNNDATLSLDDTTAIGLNFLYAHDAVRTVYQTINNNYSGRIIEQAELKEPPNTKVQEVVSSDHGKREADFFAEFYAQPVRGMVIIDRYLDSIEKILNRLGAHISLAQQHNELEWVVVKTRKGQQEQKDAIKKLKANFSQVRIKFEMDYHTPHDRLIELTRTNGQKARVILGMGLDFIASNGSVQQTFLIFQDPYEER